MQLSLGFSPCPNDTFIFHGLVSGKAAIDGYTFQPHLHDVETLNQMAFAQTFDITKLSFYAWLKVKQQYRLLSSGGALGYGCGPVVISTRPMLRKDVQNCRVVLPGQWTTAHLLFQLWAPEAQNRIFTSYDRIFDHLRSGDADCGVIIHESRFTFEQHGFHAVGDLGAWWESLTRLPIPLGCIAVSTRLSKNLDASLNSAIRESIRLARQAPMDCLDYIRAFAKEISTDVVQSHIDCFVNAFSLDMGPTGFEAVAALEERARQAGIIQ